MLETIKNRNQMKKKCQVKRIPNGEIITWKISLKIHQGVRYPLIHTKLKMSNSQREDDSKQTKLSTKFHEGTRYQRKRLAFHQHTLDKDHKKSVLKKIG